jgi:hypothetical protein
MRLEGREQDYRWLGATREPDNERRSGAEGEK